MRRSLGAVPASAALIALAAACVTPIVPQADKSRHLDLIVPDEGLSGWRDVRIRGRTEFAWVGVGGTGAIRAVGRDSASGLLRLVRYDAGACPTLSWSWRVEAMQPSADLRRKELEDVAASIFVLFGDPGLLSSPNQVPTLRYVWTNGRHAKEEVIDNPYLPGLVRSIVVENGAHGLGAWLHVTRRVEDDYRAAFGEPPRDAVHAIALFTDNDQTGEPVIAYYRSLRVGCGPTAVAAAVERPDAADCSGSTITVSSEALHRFASLAGRLAAYADQCEADGAAEFRAPFSPNSASPCLPAPQKQEMTRVFDEREAAAAMDFLGADCGELALRMGAAKDEWRGLQHELAGRR